jgi:peptidoglycan/LPS O-acetylase OafA/YrhL
VWLGVRSYGIYLYHLPIFEVLTPSRLHLRLAIVLPIRVIVTLIVAAASYRFVEARFLRRKSYPIPDATGAEHEARTVPRDVARSHESVEATPGRTPAAVQGDETVSEGVTSKSVELGKMSP